MGGLRSDRIGRKRRLLLLALLLAVVAAVIPAYARVYRVAGHSDAPTFQVGSRVLVLQAAYDVRLPYTDIVLYARASPRLGDVVMFRAPDHGAAVFKRLLGAPGDTVAMQDGHAVINGAPLRYQPVDAAPFTGVAVQNHLGPILERESGHGPAHLISRAAPGPVPTRERLWTISPDHYFLVGDNRGQSRDSRHYGPVPREAVLGRVVPLTWPWMAGEP